ncbi:ABC transporter permease subunit [Apibacter adventoris]|uniref:Gliding motility protein Gldf n=1 Tax=Apibacter adventoris TaxID=1679466 RepID=A0A2S8AFW5_9FLAO|nr:ABC transporter permease subunit [Apibacter adventoris]PQL93832.1 gliding motility protein Gldf [Apibacter adventoris]PQL95260.1 gliding motility protein Gldf [Apibacter adventoris]
MFSIFKKEIGTYFGTMGAYIIASIFTIICTLFLWFFDNNFNIFNIGLANLNNFFVLSPWVLLFLIPALTMKSIAEEEENNTLIWLFSQPISIFSVVLGKYFAILTLVLFSLLGTIVYVYSTYMISLPTGNIDLGMVLSGYIGLIFLSMTFISVGIFASSLVKNQVLAFILGVFLSFFCFFGFENLASYNLLGNFDYILQKIGFYQHYISFTKGIIDTRDLGYFLFITFLFLTISIKFIKRKK